MVLDPFPLLNALMWDKAAFLTLMDYAGAGGVLPKQALYLRDKQDVLAPRIAVDWAGEETILLKNPDVQNGQGVTLYSPSGTMNAPHPANGFTFCPLDQITYPVGIAEGGDLSSVQTKIMFDLVRPSRHPMLIAQEITDGVTIDGYKPTFRVPISLWREGNTNFGWTIHPAYWKFPKKKTRREAFRDAVISRASEKGRIFDKEEQSHLQGQVEMRVMPVIQSLVKTPPITIIQHLLDSDSAEAQVMGMMLFATNIVTDSRCYGPDNKTFHRAAGVLDAHPGLRDFIMSRRPRPRHDQEAFCRALSRYSYRI